MRFTIKAKLVLAFTLIIVFMGGMATYAINSLANSKATLDEVVEQYAKRLQNVQQLNIVSLQLVRAQKNLILAKTPEEVQRFVQAGDESRKDFETIRQQMESTAAADRKPYWIGLRGAMEKVEKDDDQIRDLVRASNVNGAAEVSSGAGRQHAQELVQMLEDGVTANVDRMDAATKEADAEYNSNRNIMLIVVCVALLTAIGFAAWIAITISRGLNQAISVAQSLAAGDLTRDVEVTSRDEIGDLLTAFSDMVEKLRSIVTEAISASDNVSSGSQQMAATSEQLAQGSAEQASAGEQASSSSEEMAANIKQNASNASETERIARQSAKDAEVFGQRCRPCRHRHADHRREDHHRAGDRSSDRPPGPQRRRRGRSCR